MAATIVKKDAGGGWIEATIGVTGAGIPAHKQKEYLAIVKINMAAYDALVGDGGASQGEFVAVTLGQIIAEAFD